VASGSQLLNGPLLKPAPNFLAVQSTTTAPPATLAQSGGLCRSARARSIQYSCVSRTIESTGFQSHSPVQARTQHRKTNRTHRRT